MRIGNLEIRIRSTGILPVGQGSASSLPTDLSGVFAVSDQEAWWLAVHQVVDQAEKETIEGARMRIKETNMCIAAVGAGEGVALVRNKLIAARENALKGVKPRQGGATPQGLAA